MQIKNKRSFIVGLKSTKLNNLEVKFLKRYKPWGVILFSRNIKSINQAKELTKNIKKIFHDDNYPILIDQEGGRVSRLSKIIDTSIFTGEYFENLYKKDYRKFKVILKLYIKTISVILKKIGVNINTVPLLDVRFKNGHNIIGNRSFGSDPKIINKIGDFFIKEYHKNHIGTVIKHIPGHGRAKVDSHLTTPTVSSKINLLKKIDFATFKKKNSFFAMTAHIIYKDIDKENPATHSKKIIELIRNKIKYRNILMSDDISMKGLKLSIKDNTIKAFEAGCNLVLHCNGRLDEMHIVAENSPKINNTIVKKTSQFYKILS